MHFFSISYLSLSSIIILVPYFIIIVRSFVFIAHCYSVAQILIVEITDVTQCSDATTRIETEPSVTLWTVSLWLTDPLLCSVECQPKSEFTHTHLYVSCTHTLCARRTRRYNKSSAVNYYYVEHKTANKSRSLPCHRCYSGDQYR